MPPQAILPVFRGDIGVARDGRPFVKDLFATFKASSLPDKVNKPTLTRLNQFLEDQGLGIQVCQPPAPAVRTCLLGCLLGLDRTLTYIATPGTIGPLPIRDLPLPRPSCSRGFGLQATPMTVREVYSQVCKFHAPRTCCWQRFADMAHGCSYDDLAAKLGDSPCGVEETARLQNVLQRLFAQCAGPVADEVEEALAKQTSETRA